MLTRVPPLPPAQVALHKPQSSSGLGIRLEQHSVRTRGGHTRAVVVGALLPGAFSQSSGALRAGGRVAITPTPNPNPNPNPNPTSHPNPNPNPGPNQATGWP